MHLIIKRIGYFFEELLDIKKPSKSSQLFMTIRQCLLWSFQMFLFPISVRIRTCQFQSLSTVCPVSRPKLLFFLSMPDQNSYIFCVRALVFPKLLYFLRTSPCFLQNDFLERYDKLLRNSLCKVTNVKMDDNQFLQAVLPAAKGGLGVSSARLLALPAF